MEKDIQYRDAQPQDVPGICNLVLEIFDKYIGYDYLLEGQSTFRMFCDPKAMASRISNGRSFCIIAIQEQDIIGMIEVRDTNHIALLFVDERYHRKGIAKNLVDLAIKKANLSVVEVNSSPYAFNIYKNMGFIQLDNEQERDGIRFIPMSKCIDSETIC